MLFLEDMIASGEEATDDQRANALILLGIVNEFSATLGKSFHCTSGIRSMAKHLEIYAKLRMEDASEGKPLRPIPMHSSHLDGNAIDIICLSLSIEDFQRWFLEEAQLELAEDLGLWFEAFEYSPTWIHCQRIAPVSGSRFFRPY